ncbi:C-type lectin domain family 4 member A-like isoform X2 [Phalacrocorax aristotelis]|uniref:C-type lectin domain family 4 member A-like isoform X2 n=2 Tax=Phalacrocorax aristotelis TaxID=126867 RepID=UPI003F4C21B1
MLIFGGGAGGASAAGGVGDAARPRCHELVPSSPFYGLVFFLNIKIPFFPPPLLPTDLGLPAPPSLPHPRQRHRRANASNGGKNYRKKCCCNEALPKKTSFFFFLSFFPPPEAGAAGLWARRKGEAWKQLATKTFREATKARSKAQIRRFLGPAAGAGRAVTAPAAAPERPRDAPAPAMAAEVLYADLRLPGARSPPAGRRHAPALCPQWHGVLLKVGGLGHLVLLALVAVLSVQVFQGSLQPATTCAPRPGSEMWGRNRTEQCLVSSLMRYFCEPRRETPAASAGCRLCPQGWQLRGERCYRLSKEKGSWTQGKKDCENQKSHLVVLRDKKEEEHIKNITGGRTQPVWVGLTSSEKKWRWVDNTTLDAKTFSALKEAGEGCWTLKGEAWEVDTCDGEHEWVCQKDPFRLSPSVAGDGEKCDGSL